MRFTAVSVLATLVDTAVYWFALHLAPGAPAWWVGGSAAMGYVAGTALHFALARRLVFKPSSLHASAEAALVFLVAAIGLGLTVLITVALANGAHWDKLVARGVALVVVFCWNYLGRRYLVYRTPGVPSPESAGIPAGRGEG